MMFSQLKLAQGPIGLSAIVFVIVATAMALLSSCSSAPVIPADDAAMYERLTGVDSQGFLRQVSEYDWDDGGKSVAARLNWIEDSAGSADRTVAEHAGESADAIANFLSAEVHALSRIRTGWFGVQHRTVGQLNPDLVQAYASALTPYQGALVGEDEDIRGFDGDPRSLAARHVFAVIDTSTDAGNAFKDGAYQRVRRHLRTYGQAVALDRPADLVALQHAAQLAGAVAGGQEESGNEAIATMSSQSWINWAGYEVAVASGARPGDPDIPSRFFAPDGRLLSPEEVARGDLDHFSTAVENFAFKHGAPSMGNEFDRWYENATGQ